MQTNLTERLARGLLSNCKHDLLDWARFNRKLLSDHELYATGTSGRLLEEELQLPVVRFLSGPLGGDQQIGSQITDGEINFLIVFWDRLEPHPHDPDVKALLRVAVVWNIPIACTRTSADFIISSPLMSQEYSRRVLAYDDRHRPGVAASLNDTSGNRRRRRRWSLPGQPHQSADKQRSDDHNQQ